MFTKTFRSTLGTIEYYAADEQVNSNPALVLLHGAGASALVNWQMTIDRLQDRYRIMAINLPGAGNTSWYNPDISFDELTNTLLALVDAETKDPFLLVGYSTGAMLAIHLAAQESARVRYLVSIAPWLTNDPRMTFFFDFSERLATIDLTLFARYNTLTAFSQAAHTHMDADSFAATVKALSSTGVNQDLTKLIRMNRDTVTVQQDLLHITAPTTIIGFSDDRICPIHYARQVAKDIPGARFVQIEAGHGGPWEAPEAMNREIDEALSKRFLTDEPNGVTQ